MKPTARHGSASTPGVLAGTAICATAAGVIVAGIGATVVATGLADDARRFLRFGFAGVEQTPTEAAAIALHNARLAGGTLLAAAARPHLPAPARTALDVVLAAVLAINTAALGLALGAYGARAVTAVALHLPLELVALSLAGGAYMQTRKQPLSMPAVARVAAACAPLLAIAATLETYTALGGPR